MNSSDNDYERMNIKHIKYLIYYICIKGGVFIIKEEYNSKFFQLINDDCLTAMQNISDKSIDAIITDLPYGRSNR